MISKGLLHENTISDLSALEILYLKYRVPLLKFLVKHYTLEIADAIDIAQEAFAIFLQKAVSNELPAFEKESNLKSFLFAIAKNKFRENARVSKKIKLVAEFPYMENQDTEDWLVKEEKIQRAEAAFAQLDQKCRLLLHHAIVLKTSMREIARLLEYKNAATAKNLKLKCLRKLRRFFINQ